MMFILQYPQPKLGNKIILLCVQTQQEFQLVFQDRENKTGTKKVVFIIQLTTDLPSEDNYPRNVFKLKDFPQLININFSTELYQINSANFAFLNNISFSQYLLSDPQKQTQVLRSYYTFYTNQTNLSAQAQQSSYNISYQNHNGIDQTTGYHLCFGSQLGGVFQNQLRGNSFIWLWVVFTCFFWIFAACLSKQGPQTEQQHFNNNNLTAWSLYSLWYLGNPFYFNKFMRLVLFYDTVSFHIFFIACLGQLRIYDLKRATILRYALSSILISFPPSYIFGFIINYINQLQLKLFLQKFKLKGILKVQSLEDMATNYRIIQLQDKIFFWEFWYYTTAILIAISLPIAYVALQMHNATSTFHIVQSAYDCAAWAVSFILYFFIIQPFLSYLIGHTAFWRNRGFFYDIRLSNAWKQIKPY